jgi:hypothetical protein
VKLEWENLSENTIRRCFIKSQILPPNLHYLILAVRIPKQTKYKTIQSTPTHDQHQQQTASVSNLVEVRNSANHFHPVDDEEESTTNAAVVGL